MSLKPFGPVWALSAMLLAASALAPAQAQLPDLAPAQAQLPAREQVQMHAQPQPPAPEEDGTAAFPVAAIALLGVEALLPHLAGGQPFARPLAIARRLARQDAEIAATLAGLDEVAPQGAATPAALAESFAATADRVIAQDLGLGAAGGAGRLAAGAVRLAMGWQAGRAIGFDIELPFAPTPLLGVMRNAAARLAEGDLAGADAALGRLEAPAAAAFAPWRGQARARVRVDAAAARLANLATARLAASP